MCDCNIFILKKKQRKNVHREQSYVAGGRRRPISRVKCFFLFNFIRRTTARRRTRGNSTRFHSDPYFIHTHKYACNRRFIPRVTRSCRALIRLTVYERGTLPCSMRKTLAGAPHVRSDRTTRIYTRTRRAVITRRRGARSMKSRTKSLGRFLWDLHRAGRI